MINQAIGTDLNIWFSQTRPCFIQNYTVNLMKLQNVITYQVAWVTKTSFGSSQPKWHTKQQFSIIFTRIKNIVAIKSKYILHHKKLVFRLCQGFSTCLSILKCVSKLLWIHFEIFKMNSCQIWTLYNTFTVPEAHKYEINKTSTTDTDYEHMNTSRRCRNYLKSPKFIKSLNIHSLGSIFS